MTTARAAREAGANMLRGGAFKPRSSPYTFRGMGEEALQLMAAAREETGLPCSMAEDPLSTVVLGAGKMLSNFELLRKISLD